MENETPKEIVFVPGCFDDFEGTQEELELLKAEILAIFQDGSFLENSIPIDELPEEEQDFILNRMETKDQRNLQ